MAEPLTPEREADIREMAVAAPLRIMMEDVVGCRVGLRDLLAELDRLRKELKAAAPVVPVPDTTRSARRSAWLAKAAADAEATHWRRLGITPPSPDSDAGDEGELARLRELERRVTEQLEDFEEGLEEDPGAPAVARNMTELLARAVRGDQR